MNITNLTPAEKLWGFFGIAFVLAGVSIAGHGYIYGAEASKTKAKIELSEKDITILEKQRIIAELTDAMVALEGKASKKGGVLSTQKKESSLRLPFPMSRATTQTTNCKRLIFILWPL
jgi:hypothetical protein